MRGWAWWHRPTTISHRQEARRAFEQALAIDPESIGAKIGLAATITQILVEGWSSSFDQDQVVAERLLHEVLDRDSHQPMARAMMGLLRRVQNRLSEAQAEVEMAIGLDRNNELALKQLGQILLFQGKPAAGIPHLEKAIRLNPRGPNLYSIQWPLGQCHLLLGHVDEAIDLFRKACAASPRAYYLHLNLAGALGLRGDLDERGRLWPRRSSASEGQILWRVIAQSLLGLPITALGASRQDPECRPAARRFLETNDDHSRASASRSGMVISATIASVVRWRQ
jgi:tetratricopeptide (TPR) repeat protein